MSKKADSQNQESFDADPQTQETATPEATATPEITPTPEPTPAPDLAAENAKLKAQLEATQKVQVTVQQQTPPPAPQQFTQEQLQAQAEALGFSDTKQIETIGKIAAGFANQALQKANLLEQELKLERAVNKAKKNAQNQDPQFNKLEPFVDEYLDGVSVEDRLDPEKLNKHMERATFYAKGKMGVTTNGKRPAAPPPTPRGEEVRTEEAAMTGPETWTTRDGKNSITIEPRVSQKVRDMHKHPTIDGGVQIDPREEWKPAVFAKRTDD